MNDIVFVLNGKLLFKKDILKKLEDETQTRGRYLLLRETDKRLISQFVKKNSTSEIGKINNTIEKYERVIKTKRNLEEQLL